MPEGWSFERLGNITNIARGGSPRPIEKYLTDNKNGLNWIKIGDTSKDGKYISSTKEKISPDGLNKTRFVSKGDFLLTNSMSFGRPYILKIDGCIHDGWLVIGNIETVFNADYLYYALSSNFMYQTLSLIAAGSTVKNLKSDSVKSVLFPIPPMSEQKRISKKLEIIINFIDNINSEKNVLIDTIQRIKSKILDLAIRGKLVPQDPNDEPASVLLERIRTEKEELIKQGKIKRDKKESVIFKGDDNSYYEKIGNTTVCIDEELPFEIPDNWTWSRLQTCCCKDIKRGKSPKYANSGNALVFAQKCNTKYDGINLNLALFLDETTIEKYSDTEFMQNNDIVINSTGNGTLGRVGVYKEINNTSSTPIVPDSHVTVIRSNNCIMADYLYAFLKSSQRILEKMGEGSTNQRELKPITLKYMLVPIPPYKEQMLIVDLIKKLNTIIRNVEANLN